MPTTTEHIPCPKCGATRPIRIDYPNKARVAANRPCLSCANTTRNLNRHRPDADPLVVQFLLSGTRVTSNAAEREIVVAFLTKKKRMSITQIAALMHCTTRTVERHRAKLAAA